MKKLKYLSFALLIALCAGFVSCSDDDDDEPGQGGDVSMLIGTWEPTSYYYCTKANGKVMEENRDMGGLLIQVFTEDGTVYGYRQDHSLSKTETYSYNNGKLTIIDDDGDAMQHNVSFPSSSELVLEVSASEQYNGVKYEAYQKVTYRKIEDFR